MNYTEKYLEEVKQVVDRIDHHAIELIVSQVNDLRKRRGRLFFLGVGGSAANSSHAVNDFRKIVGVDSYTPIDNVSELTARTNDDGWGSVFVEWLKGSHLSDKDMVFVLSVGGGSLEKNISPNLVRALEYAKEIGSGVVGIVGRDGGFTAQVADACVIIPTVDPDRVTPHVESFASVILHLMISHPLLQKHQMKWESTK